MVKKEKITFRLYVEDDSNNVKSVQVNEYKLPDKDEYKYPFNFSRNEGFGCQIDVVLDCLDEGRIECPEYNWNEMMIIMRFMDEARRQIGLKHAAD